MDCPKTHRFYLVRGAGHAAAVGQRTPMLASRLHCALCFRHSAICFRPIILTQKARAPRSGFPSSSAACRSGARRGSLAARHCPAPLALAAPHSSPATQARWCRRSPARAWSTAHPTACRSGSLFLLRRTNKSVEVCAIGTALPDCTTYI